MKFIWATATHQGMVREINEDSLFPTDDGQTSETVTLMVADGMGGHVAGEVASRLAVNAAASTDLAPADRVAAGNRAIREEVGRQPDLEGMGTTMTMVELKGDGDTAHFAHVGDSRAYMLRGGELTQVTQDHTVMAEYVASGKLTPDEAANHPQRHMITRCLGLTRFVNVDEMIIDLEPGDRILICSDGLNSMVDDKKISEGLGNGNAADAAWKLIELANEAGGQDNITVIVADALDQ
jgi:protein phosphatase